MKKNFKLFIGIVGFILMILLGVLWNKMGNIKMDSQNISLKSVEQTFILDNIEEIYLNLINTEVKWSVTSGDTAAIKFSYPDSSNIGDEFIQVTSGTILNIEQVTEFAEKKKQPRYIEISMPAAYRKSVRVNTSGTVKFENPGVYDKVSLVTGDLHINSIESKDFEIKSTAGLVQINKLNTETYQISKVSGKLNLNSISGSGILNQISGDADIYLNEKSKDMEVEEVHGSVRVFVPDNYSFSFSGSTEVSSGATVSSNDFILNYTDEKRHAELKVGNDDNNIKISSIRGDLKINKN